MSTFPIARRARHLNASAIRQILKLTEGGQVLSLAGGLPSPQAFPLEALQEASARVWAEQGREALQYATSEGLPSLREWVAAHLRERGMAVSAADVLITTGSQQGLSLLGQVMVDAGAGVLVEAPTYLGALQAFTPCEPELLSWEGDAHGPLPDAIAPHAALAYLLPNYQNPTGRCIGQGRRTALVRQAQAQRLPLIEDDPYGDLWYDQPPPPPLATAWPEGVVYLGSFSKVLAPGLRLGYVVTPRGAEALRAKLLQAKQACDLHTAGFNQRLVMALLEGGFDMDKHLTAVRTRYRRQRDAMAEALRRHLPSACHWHLPEGGMFFWLTWPDSMDVQAALPMAVEQGVAYVPGASFYAHQPRLNTMRLSFVTLTPQEIDEAVRRLARALLPLADA